MSTQVADAGSRHPFLHVDQVLIQEIIDVAMAGLRHGQSLVVGRVCFQDVFEEFARGRLATFGHPKVGNDAVTIRTPDARDKDWIGRENEVTGRGSSDGGQTSKGLRLIVLCRRAVELIRAEVDFGPDGSNPTSIGINDTTANSNTSRKSKICRGLFTQVAGQFTGGQIFSILKTSPSSQPTVL